MFLGKPILVRIQEISREKHIGYPKDVLRQTYFGVVRETERHRYKETQSWRDRQTRVNSDREMGENKRQ